MTSPATIGVAKGFWPVVQLIAGLTKRLYFGVREELVALMEMPGVKLGRAKMLYAAGYTRY